MLGRRKYANGDPINFVDPRGRSPGQVRDGVIGTDKGLWSNAFDQAWDQTLDRMNGFLKYNPLTFATYAAAQSYGTELQEFDSHLVALNASINPFFSIWRNGYEAVEGMGLHVDNIAQDLSAAWRTWSGAKAVAETALLFLPFAKGGGVPKIAPISAELQVVAEEIPSVVYRGGGKNPGNLTPRPLDEGMLSTRDSLSNPWPKTAEKPPLPVGEPIQVIDTTKLPPGSVVPDGTSYGSQPPGHVSIGPNVPPDVLKNAIIQTIPKSATQ